MIEHPSSPIAPPPFPPCSRTEIRIPGKLVHFSQILCAGSFEGTIPPKWRSSLTSCGFPFPPKWNDQIARNKPLVSFRSPFSFPSKPTQGYICCLLGCSCNVSFTFCGSHSENPQSFNQEAFKPRICDQIAICWQKPPDPDQAPALRGSPAAKDLPKAAVAQGPLASKLTSRCQLWFSRRHHSLGHKVSPSFGDQRTNENQAVPPAVSAQIGLVGVGWRSFQGGFRRVSGGGPFGIPPGLF